MNEKLRQKIIDRKQKGTIRSLSVFEGNIDFCSNNYLGLHSTEEHLNCQFPATGSRLISGTTATSLECEKLLAEHFGSEAALFFNSGYTANLGFFSCVPQKGDVVLYDADIHASVRDGLRLSLAKSFAFAHNDVVDLERLLEKQVGTIYVVVESLYSMGGDFSPLGAILQLCKQYGAKLIVDEAHSIGVFGGKGKGVLHHVQNIDDVLLAKVITFGKAFGAHGAAILCSAEMKEYLVNFSRPFIYTTAPSEQTFKRVAQLILDESIPERQGKLQEVIIAFRANLPEASLASEFNSPIQMIRFKERENLKNCVTAVTEKGMNVKAIYAPTVLEEKEGLRVSLHAFNSVEQARRLAEIVNEYI